MVRAAVCCLFPVSRDSLPMSEILLTKMSSKSLLYFELLQSSQKLLSIVNLLMMMMMISLSFMKKNITISK